MEIKVGIDLVKDNRVMKRLENKGFLERVYHSSEVNLFRDKLVSIFALKEAVFKALEIPVSWLDVEVKYKDSGKSQIVLSSEILPVGLINIDSSVSHENGLTIAVVNLLLDEKE